MNQIYEVELGLKSICNRSQPYATYDIQKDWTRLWYSERLNQWSLRKIEPVISQKDWTSDLLICLLFDWGIMI